MMRRPGHPRARARSAIQARASLLRAAAPVPSPSEIMGLVLDRRFAVEYQPVVDLQTGETIGHEALARFFDARGRPVPPAGVFARLHEDPPSLLQVELETKRLHVEHAPAGALYVNIDPDSYHEDRATGGTTLLDALAASGSPVVVEAIEARTSVGARRGRALLRAVRARGLGVALDDVGAPDTLLSLEALIDLDVLKLDRSWLDRAGNPRERAVLEALASLARRLDTRTVLEGIETASHLALARAVGVDAVQGFLFRDRFLSSAAA